MALLMQAEGLSKLIGSRTLFKGITLSFADGERIGMIGPNGSGKSTLMKILAGIEHADSGEFTKKRNLRLAYLPQEDRFEDGETVEEAVVSAQKDEPIDDHDKMVRAHILLSKMGFEDFHAEASTLSGGWRKRLAIAREVIKSPDLLLLDEPTNHLDLEGIVWLEGMLKSASFAFVLVSHDRYLLDNVSSRVVEINSAYPNGFLSIDGAYTTFMEKREEFLEAQASQQASLAGRVRREVEWLQRGAKARTTKAKGRINQAHQMMSDLADLKQRNSVGQAAGIDFMASERQTRKLISAKKVSKSLGGKRLITDLDLILAPGMKLGLVGPNGSGKTTFIKLLAGELEPDSGQMLRADHLRVVLFDQARKQLDQKLSVKESLSPGSETVVYRGQSMHVSGWARQFLFRTDQLTMPVGDLSGGEQARILIARLMLQPADVLILDEPTNDLDIPTLQILEESLEDFAGALVLVTHDRYMLDRLSTDLLGLDGRGNARMFGDLSQWERWRKEGDKEAQKPAAKSSGKPAENKPKAKALSYMELRELEQIEGKIATAEEILHGAQRMMDEPAVLADRKKLADVCAKMESAQKAVHDLYARWEMLEAKRPDRYSASMLNYIWAGLIVLSLVFAMTSDLTDIQSDRYRNKVPLTVQLKAKHAGDFDNSELPVDVIISPAAYQTFYSINAQPAASYAGSVSKSDRGYSIRFAKDVALPEPWSTMREAMTDDPSDTGELRGKIQNIHIESGSATATADLTLEPVRFLKLRKITQAALSMAAKAVTLALSLIGGLALWLGMLRIAEKSGLINVFVKIVRPVLHPLFPEVPKDHPALGMIALNISAGMLGLGNAATPMGLKAMEELQTLNPTKDTATNPMVMLLALNTTCPQLIPSPTLLAILGLGAANVWLPTIVATACAMGVAIVATKLLGKIGKFRATDPNRN